MRQSRFYKSITGRLLLQCIGLATATLVCLGLFNYYQKHNEMMNELHVAADKALDRLKNNLPAAIWFEEEGLAQILKSELQDPNAVQVSVWSNENKITHGFKRNEKNEVLESKDGPVPAALIKKSDLIYVKDKVQKKVGQVGIYFSDSIIWGKLKKELLASFLQVLILDIILILGMWFILTRKLKHPLLGVNEHIQVDNRHLKGKMNNLTSCVDKLRMSAKTQSDAANGTVAAVTQITQMLSQMQEYMNETKTFSQNIQNMSNDGVGSMRKVEDAMNEIRSSNERLQEIIQIIHDISQKTTIINDIVVKTQLLSFNASIEAARAGQHGKGFAVVAQEIGNLAILSGQAAGEIDQLLESSQKNVEIIVQETSERVNKGNDVTGLAQQIFGKISENISAIVTKIEKVADASHEQKVALDNTLQAIREMDNAIRGNTSVAEDVTGIAKELHSINESINSSTGGLVKFVHGD